jgi:HPt (histidine-containing phosphotransfer) domain-containing protein
MTNLPNPPIQWEYLDALADGDKAFEQELLRLFVRDAWDHAEQLSTAIDAVNYPEVYAAAHHLKGASGNVGAVGIAKLARVLEDQAQNKQLPPNAAEMMQDLTLQLQQITDFLAEPDSTESSF